MAALKIKEFTGLQRIAPETIERHSMEQALRDAQYARGGIARFAQRFLMREGKLRQEYLTAWQR